MKKEDNDWCISGGDGSYNRSVEINGTLYYVSTEAACIAHAVLLLVDAINDKK